MATPRGASPIALAAGENAIGDGGVRRADRVARDRGRAARPREVGRRLGRARRDRPIAAAGLRYCPHYLGAGIGLLASAHVVAARGRADGLLEVDSNENPLRTGCARRSRLGGGRIELSRYAGLGVEPDLAALRALCAR